MSQKMVTVCCNGCGRDMRAKEGTEDRLHYCFRCTKHNLNDFKNTKMAGTRDAKHGPNEDDYSEDSFHRDD